jgi:hypothetical protein
LLENSVQTLEKESVTSCDSKFVIFSTIFFVVIPIWYTAIAIKMNSKLQREKMSKGPVVGTDFTYFNMVLFYLLFLFVLAVLFYFNPSGDLFYADSAVC